MGASLGVMLEVAQVMTVDPERLPPGEKEATDPEETDGRAYCPGSANLR
jgi:hypothetical protein